MKSRLPSTSSVSDAELSPAVEKMMDARMGIPQALSQCKVAVTAIPTKSSQTVLKAKDTNVMAKKNYSSAKWKLERNRPLQSTAPTRISQGAPTDTEEEADEPICDIETDSFYSGVHLLFFEIIGYSLYVSMLMSMCALCLFLFPQMTMKKLMQNLIMST